MRTTHPLPRRLRTPTAPEIHAKRQRELEGEARQDLGPPRDEPLMRHISEQVFGKERPDSRLSIDDVLTDDGKTFGEEARDSAQMLALVFLWSVLVLSCGGYALYRWLA